MKKTIAAWLRAWADKLDPPKPTETPQDGPGPFRPT